MFAIVRTTVLSPYTRFAEQMGVPLEAALRRAGLPTHFEEFPNAWLPYQNVSGFIDVLVQQEPEAETPLAQFSPNPSECLHPAMWLPLSHRGTLFQALQDLERLSRNHVSDFRSQVTANGDKAVFKCWIPLRPQHVECAFGIQEARSCEMLIGIIQRFARRANTIDRVFLMSRSRVIRRAVRKAVGDIPVLTGQPFSGVEFSRSLLSCQPIVAEDAFGGARDDGPTDEDLLQRLAACLEPFLPDGHPTITLGAEIAGTSVRTLQRRLARQGTSYDEVVETVRTRKALAMLDEGGAKLKDIAYLIGYSEQSAFSRAFSKWTGMSPRQYQRNQTTDAPAR